MDIKITKTHYERCEPVGKEILRQAKEEKAYRKNWADKEIGQSCKEVATFLAGQARGRVSIMIDSTSWEKIFGRKRKNA